MTWPPKYDFNNPITKIYCYDFTNYFDFELKDGTKSENGCSGKQIAHVLDTDRISKVVITHYDCYTMGSPEIHEEDK